MNTFEQKLNEYGLEIGSFTRNKLAYISSSLERFTLKNEPLSSFPEPVLISFTVSDGSVLSKKLQLTGSDEFVCTYFPELFELVFQPKNKSVDFEICYNREATHDEISYHIKKNNYLYEDRLKKNKFKGLFAPTLPLEEIILDELVNFLYNPETKSLQDKLYQEIYDSLIETYSHPIT